MEQQSLRGSDVPAKFEQNGQRSPPSVSGSNSKDLHQPSRPIRVRDLEKVVQATGWPGSEGGQTTEASGQGSSAKL